MKIQVIGLGLIGGSLCKALSRGGVHRVLGMDIDPETVRKAFCNCTFYLSLMLSVSFVILAVQQEMLMKDVFFECISAIGTVGLSTGITRDLLPLSKALVLLLMYVGRVGSVTVFIAVSRKKTSKLRYPVEHIIIG